MHSLIPCLFGFHEYSREFWEPTKVHFCINCMKVAQVDNRGIWDVVHFQKDPLLIVIESIDMTRWFFDSKSFRGMVFESGWEENWFYPHKPYQTMFCKNNGYSQWQSNKCILIADKHDKYDIKYHVSNGQFHVAKIQEMITPFNYWRYYQDLVDEQLKELN